MYSIESNKLLNCYCARQIRCKFIVVILCCACAFPPSYCYLVPTMWLIAVAFCLCLDLAAVAAVQVFFEEHLLSGRFWRRRRGARLLLDRADSALCHQQHPSARARHRMHVVRQDIERECSHWHLSSALSRSIKQ